MKPKHHLSRLCTSMLMAAALWVGGCATSAPSSKPVEPIVPLRGSPVSATQSDYSAAMACMANVAGRQSYPAPRIAVGHITDMTGADDIYLGRRLTQGATLMAITAVSNTGMRVIERFDTGVTQADLEFANNRMLRDSPTVIRVPQQGQIQGVDLYIVGGISEYNHNIQSRGQDVSIGSSGRNVGSVYASNGDYVVDVGMDLRLIDARTTEVIAVRSYRKQVRGRQRELGALIAANKGTLDIGAGGRQNEPIQMAIRNIIDRSVFEFAAGLYEEEAQPCKQLARQAEFVPARTSIVAAYAGAGAPQRWTPYQSVPLAPWLRQAQETQGGLTQNPPVNTQGDLPVWQNSSPGPQDNPVTLGTDDRQMMGNPPRGLAAPTRQDPVTSQERAAAQMLRELRGQGGN